MSKSNFNIINARVTFRNIPLHKLEKYSFKDLNAATDAFKKITDVSECVIVQNSFRVEVFLIVNLESGDVPDARRSEGKHLTVNKILETWKSLTELDQYDIDHFDQTLEVYRNTDVYLHLLRLAVGLESFLVGREEILDEVKGAISSAKLAKASGKILNKLFDICIRQATKIRESTGISKGVISIGDIAVKIAEENAGMDGKKHVLLVGTGESAAMVAKAIMKKGYAFDVTSRSIERSTGFSKILGGKPVSFEDVLSGFDKFDIIIVATTADYFIITLDRIKRVMENKKKGIMILDISEPRAIDEKVSVIPGIKLMFRDQIGELYEEDAKIRARKVPDVEKMINKEVPIIEATMNRLEAEPKVKGVLVNVDSLRKKELEKALKMLGETDKEKIKIIDELTKEVVKNIISVPSKKSDQENT